MHKSEIADRILDRLIAESQSIRHSFETTRDAIGYFVVDDLLPVELATEIYNAFPDPGTMKLRKSLREHKFVAAQMDKYEPLLEQVVYAFQDPRIVHKIGELLKMDGLLPDDRLYAGGISLMGECQFLNPHLDNSHDHMRENSRMLNLLYYVSPDWNIADGGNLEVWPDGVDNKPETIANRFNRLVVMATNNTSWHSVSPIKTAKIRCCVSNYYFSETPPEAGSEFHVTTFRGRPEQKVRDKILRADAILRTAVRKLFSRGVIETDHIYKK
jgi:Rps23 Pro-64 3,4-dihydroxylase Tpa1-like proline 4-hydroxylase